MRTTTFIALVGSASATAAAGAKKAAVVVAPTLANSCVKAGDAKCTVELCYDAASGWLGAKHPGCDAAWETDANNCEHGDHASCTNDLCTGETWANCKTCHDSPFTASCWSNTNASDACMWAGTDCTVDICASHESRYVKPKPVVTAAKTVGKVTTPAVHPTLTDWETYYWSQHCNDSKVHTIELDNAKVQSTDDDFNTLVTDNNATHAAALKA
jgi:hypothetical protein